MAVYARYDGDETAFDGRVWTGDDAPTVDMLNRVTPDAIRGYLSAVANARLALIAAYGPDGWEIIRADPEPPAEPGVVY